MRRVSIIPQVTFWTVTYWLPGETQAREWLPWFQTKEAAEAKADALLKNREAERAFASPC